MKILCICGLKNTGKTTLMKEIIEVLSKQYRVGSLKHDGHDFNSDVKGSDSDVHHRAGASSSAVFSKNKWLMVKDEKQTLDDMIAKFDVDVLLIEGCKNCKYPKIEILRKGYSEYPVSNHPIAIVSDFDIQLNIPVLKSKQEILNFILNFIED